jgi:hypothetical protein
MQEKKQGMGDDNQIKISQSLRRMPQNHQGAVARNQEINMYGMCQT